MGKYDLSGVHVYNKFLWAKLKEEFDWLDESNYKGLIPILPSQQIPQITEAASGKPFIIYNYTDAGKDLAFYAPIQQVSYIIYSDHEGQLRQIMNFIETLSNRFDWTAEDVNHFIPSISNSSGDSDDAKFDFKYVRVMATNGPQPFEQENGRQAAMVMIRLCYTIDLVETVGLGKGMRK